MRSRSAAPKPIRHRSTGLRTRAEIVAVAERTFAERGFEATRVDDIATEVGIRRAAIFYHFGDKQGLYAAVLDEVFRDWSLPSGGSPAQRLEAALTGWIDYVARRPSVARMILREAASFQPGAVSPFMHAGSAAIEWFRAVIDEGIAAGELEPRLDSYRFLSRMGAMTVFHFAAMSWLNLNTPIDPASRAELDAHKREVVEAARGLLGVRTQSDSGGNR